MFKKIFLRVILPIILLAVGVFMFIQGIHRIQYRKSWVTTQATITHMETDGIGENETTDVYVSYEVNGVQYDGMLDEYRASFDIGDTVEIYYDPANPDSIMTGSVISVILVFAFSVLCLIATVSLVGKGLFRRR